jgi:hypothetical protein
MEISNNKYSSNISLVYVKGSYHIYKPITSTLSFKFDHYALRTGNEYYYFIEKNKHGIIFKRELIENVDHINTLEELGYSDKSHEDIMKIANELLLYYDEDDKKKNQYFLESLVFRLCNIHVKLYDGYSDEELRRNNMIIEEKQERDRRNRYFIKCFIQ